MRTVYALALALSLLGCRRHEPPVQVVALPTAAPVEVAVGSDDAQLSALRAELRELRGQLNALQLAEADAKGEAEKYRAGLQRCVDELNSQARGARSTYIPSPDPTRAPQARLSTLGAPDVQIVGDNVFVTGKVWNSGDGDASGRLYVELLRDGQVVDSATLPLDVPARTDQAYSTTFRPLISNGTYSARVRFDL